MLNLGLAPSTSTYLLSAGYLHLLLTIPGALTISRDITRMKQVHEELIKANFEVEAGNRLKTSFLAIGH